jgi:FkbM family methyltransferase
VRALANRLHPRRLRRTLGAASCVRERARFVVNELRDVPLVHEYRLRDSGLIAPVRHPLLDMWGLEEIFRLRVYEPPAQAAAALRALGRPPRVVDLGGNVGLFGLFALELFPGASIVSFEPDPANLRSLSRCIEVNDLQASWQLVEACAATAGGTVEFSSSGPLSRAAPGSDDALRAMQERIGRTFPFLEGTRLLRPERLRVERRDVFPFLVGADLVKIDIEGSEWELLADPRIAGLDAAAVVLEYHPSYGPEADAEATVRRALAGAGYETGPSLPGDGAALLWAWKGEATAEGGAQATPPGQPR